MYAKLINGGLKAAPKHITTGDQNVWNAPRETMLSLGWKEVAFTDPEEAPDGYTYEAGWTEEDERIVQTWTLVPLPDDIDEAEAYAIIFGGDEA